MATQLMGYLPTSSADMVFCETRGGGGEVEEMGRGQGLGRVMAGQGARDRLEEVRWRAARRGAPYVGSPVTVPITAGAWCI